MKGPPRCPEMLDNSDAARVLRNSTVGHLIAFQLSFLFSFCVRPVKLLILLKMFYFRQAESCSLWLITHHFPAAAVSGSPLPLQQTHKKKLAKFTWCRQVKSNTSVIVSRCGTGQRCEVSLCAPMLKWVHQKVPTSCINPASAPFHSSLSWIIS